MKSYSFILAWLVLLVFLAMPLVEGESLGIFEKDMDVQLVQTCNNCTYCNITSVKNPDSVNVLTNFVMAQDETEYSFNLSGGNTSTTGDWKYCYDCGNAVERTTGCIDFEITINGNPKPSGVVIVLFTILFLIVLAALVTLVLYTIGHFVEKDFDMKDLIFNLSAYFVVWGIYLLGREYVGNNFINEFLEWIIFIGAFTNVLIPMIIFFISITVWKWMEKGGAS